MARALQQLQVATSKAHGKRNVLRAIEAVAMRLGNTKSVCRKCYIHPAVIEAYLDGTLLERLQQGARPVSRQRRRHLGPEEAAVIALLERRLPTETRAMQSALGRRSNRVISC